MGDDIVYEETILRLLVGQSYKCVNNILEMLPCFFWDAGDHYCASHATAGCLANTFLTELDNCSTASVYPVSKCHINMTSQGRYLFVWLLGAGPSLSLGDHELLVSMKVTGKEKKMNSHKQEQEGKEWEKGGREGGREGGRNEGMREGSKNGKKERWEIAVIKLTSIKYLVMSMEYYRTKC